MSAMAKSPVEFEQDPNYFNGLDGRYEAWRKRSSEIYCIFHPRIHPANVENIKLKEGITTKHVGKIIETKNFRYCPSCFAIAKV